jgi:hypothetical protein
MYKEYETKQTHFLLSTCTSPRTITGIVNTHFGRWSRLVDVYSTHRWSNGKIDTHSARDGGIAPVNVLLNIGVVIRRWYANWKWLLCDVCYKSCSNIRHATILPLNHQRFYRWTTCCAAMYDENMLWLNQQWFSASTDFLISCGVGLFVVLRCGRSTMPSFDCSCHAIRVLAPRSVSKSGGLVHARNRYNTESVFVLEHAGTPKPAVNAACQTVAYQEESHTTDPTPGHTWGLNIGYRPK